MRGLYAITDSLLIPSSSLIETVEKALQGGVSILQYRDKILSPNERLQQASALKLLCDKYRIPLIINDDVTLAKQVKADGVHLGHDDASLLQARKELGSQAIIGISCYNSLEKAIQAEKSGADYVAFGAFFPSSSKPNAAQANISLLKQAHQTLHCPIVAIGGITPENGKQLVAAGANMLAVINGLFGQIDSAEAVQCYVELFEK
ncbi:MAG: thiamine phosphate synthase [Gammaproteobacteria bacterium]|nr:thiamine phosphate synthase [Gammaproteobacteria bacterium]